MPLNAAGLAAAIQAEMNSRFPTADAENGESGAAWRGQFAQALGAAIVSYLVANTVVVTQVSGTDSMAGPVVGAGTGGIS